jgi:hypothetical protein
VEALGHSLYRKVIRRNLPSAAPRCRCGLRGTCAGEPLFCNGVLNSPLIPAPGSRVEIPQKLTTADAADVADVRAVLPRFSDKLVCGLQPPEPNQNRTACRSPTVARPSPHHIRRELDESLASSSSPTPRLQGLSPQPERPATTITDLRVPSALTKDPATPHPRRHPQSCGDCPCGPDRWVTTITNLWVLPVLTKNPAPPQPRRHPQKLRGLSLRPDRWVTTITNLWVLPVLTKNPATPYPRRHPQSRGDCPRARIAG